MTSTLFTFKDAVDYVLDRFDVETADQASPGVPDAKSLRLARRAVLNAYRDLPHKHDSGWNYFKRSSTIRTEASYSTGTIAYTASTRAVTLSDGTWPANAALGWIRYQDDHWFVESRDSDTQVTLRAEGAPAADVDAGATYEWYREAYPLPCRIRWLELLQDGDDFSVLTYVDPGSALLTKHNYGNTNQQPYLFTLRSDDRYADALSVIFAPPPATARHYHYTAYAEPRPLRVYNYSTGTATVTAASTTCTLSGGTFDTANHVGSVIRFGDASNGPTSVFGDIDDTYNPADYERRIVSVDSATTCTLDAAITAGVSAVKFAISDPIDIYNNSMVSYFWSLCLHEFAKLYYKLDNQIKGYYASQERKDLLLAWNADRAYRGPIDTDAYGEVRSVIGDVSSAHLSS